MQDLSGRIQMVKVKNAYETQNIDPIPLKILSDAFASA
jgi:hypothetical protein